jgi:hypothetical protein
MIRAALTTAGVERTRVQSAISQGSQQRLTQVRLTQVRCRVMRGGDGQQHGWNYTGLRLETRGEQFLQTVDSGKASEFGFARSVAVARMPCLRGQKQMVLSRRESTSGVNRWNRQKPNFRAKP